MNTTINPPANPYLMQLNNLRTKMDSIVVFNGSLAGDGPPRYMELREQFGEVLSKLSQYEDGISRVLYKEISKTCDDRMARTGGCTYENCFKLRQTLKDTCQNLSEESIPSYTTGDMPKL